MAEQGESRVARRDEVSPDTSDRVEGERPEGRVISYEIGRIRRSLPLVVSRCMSFTAMSRFDEHLIAGVKEFYGLDLDVATAEAEILEDEDERIRFFPWFLWDYRRPPDTRTLGEQYRASGDHEPHERALLEALCRSWVGFYEALEDATQSGVRLLDLVTKREVFVADEGLAGDLLAGQILHARLVEVPLQEGECVLVDSVYGVMPEEARATLEVELASLEAEDAGTLVENLKAYVAEMLHFAEHLLESLSRPPDAKNGEGEAMVLSSVRLGREAALKVGSAVRRHPGFHPVEAGLLRYQEGRRVIGFVDVRSPRRARLAANSPARLDALEAAVARAADVEAPRIRSLEDFSVAVRRWAEQGGGDAWLAADPEVAEAVQTWFQAWARQWVDMPSPMLDDRTPREAIGYRDGRERVKAMLERFSELAVAGGGQRGVDELGIAGLRAELGLD